MKTRSQTRADAKSMSFSAELHKKNNDGKIKKNKCVGKKFKLKECVVRLNRLEIIEPQTNNSIAKSPPGRYTLRNRVETTKECPVKERKPLLQVVAMSQAALYTAKAIRIWEQIKKQAVKDKVQLNVNLIVCARMAGHRPWPARILSFEKNGVSLIFYGTNETGIVKKSEVLPYNICKEMMGEFLKVPLENLCNRTFSYHMLFVKASREVSCIES